MPGRKTRFELYREKELEGAGLLVHETGPWRWRLIAANGRIVAESGEGYEKATDMVRTMRKYLVGAWAQSQWLNEACKEAGLSPTGQVRKGKA